MHRVVIALLSLLLSGSLVSTITAQESLIDFDSDRWVLSNAQVMDHMGRKALMGRAFLKDVQFEDGIIEVDVWVTPRTRSYPGINFRIQSPQNYERFYMRPHRSPFYGDVLQYTPCINGIAGWQLYNGEGYTARADIQPDRWIHLRLEVQGTRARVFLDDAKEPSLVVNDLKHGVSRGTIGLDGMIDGTAYFSNFRYYEDSALAFPQRPRFDFPPGLITEWEISQPFHYTQLDLNRHPEKQNLPGITWRKVTPDANGLVDIARYYGRTGMEPDCIFARTTLRSDTNVVKELRVGYSDAVTVFFNGEPVFSGNSSYQSRDDSFLGIVGPYDAVHLPLKQGDNEVLLAVTESFGGWGFMAQDGKAIYMHERVKKVWETPHRLRTPESVVYDPMRGVYYVSNYDQFNPSRGRGLQHVSRLSENGQLTDLHWIGGLDNPTGMALRGNELLVVERGGLVIINVDSGSVVEKYPIPNPGFPNDIALDASGTAYISDSQKNVIYRFRDGGLEEWLTGEEVRSPNGVHVHNGELVWGNNGDNYLKAADLATGEVTRIASLGPGIIDGIRTSKAGNYIVSHWEGKVFELTPAGQILKVLDTSVPGMSTADIEFVSERNLLVVPTFFDNKVVAYEFTDAK